MEGVIEHIIEDIVARCRAQDASSGVHESLAAVMVKVVVLEPANHFQLDKELKAEDVENLIEVCVTRLTAKDSPALEMLRMQLAFEQAREMVRVKAQKPEDSERNETLLKEIIVSRARGAAATSALYRKILSYMLAVGKLGNSESPVTIKEANAALESIFPHNELSSFMALTRRDKTQQLQEMARIVVGIRLYNRNAGKGGAEIEDVPRVAVRESSAVAEQIVGRMHTVARQIADYTTLMNHVQFNNAKLPMGVARLTEELENRKQYQSYLKILQDDISAVKQSLTDSKTQYDAKLESVHNIVMSKTSVPTDQVYPKFVELFHLWEAMQLVREQTRGIAAVLERLTLHDSGFTPSLQTELVDAANKALDQLRRRPGSPKREIAGAAPAEEPDEPALLLATPPDDGTPIALKGYCPVTVVNRDKLLLPGKPELGVVQYRGKRYVCENEDALFEFHGAPRIYLERLIQAARLTPELVVMLDLDPAEVGSTVGDAFKPSELLPGEHPLLQPPKYKSEAGTQTADDIGERPWVDDYVWNEWELRRRALALVNMTHKKTHSSQTAESVFRKEVTTQLYPPKEAKTQTVVDASTNVPRKSRYVAGLTGKPGTKVNVVDLTLDIRL